MKTRKTKYNGSSPHTWGTLPFGFFLCGKQRFIPAYMGNTLQVSQIMNEVSVHPRIRGEHLNRDGRLCEGRFIPVTWGTPDCRGDHRLTRRVHPRIREHSDSRASPTYGSIRGEHVRVDHPDDMPPRFIPAYVGNTTDRYIRMGNTFRMARQSDACRFIPAYGGSGHGGYSDGSSPHTWGTRAPD